MDIKHGIAAYGKSLFITLVKSCSCGTSEALNADTTFGLVVQVP